MKKRHLFSFCHLSQQTPAVSEVTQNQSESEFPTQGALMQHKELKLGSVLLSEGGCLLPEPAACVSRSHKSARASAGLSYLLTPSLHLSSVPTCDKCMSVPSVRKHWAPLPLTWLAVQPPPGLLGCSPAPPWVPRAAFRPWSLPSSSSLQTSLQTSGQAPRLSLFPASHAAFHLCTFAQVFLLPGTSLLCSPPP